MPGNSALIKHYIHLFKREIDAYATPGPGAPETPSIRGAHLALNVAPETLTSSA